MTKKHLLLLLFITFSIKIYSQKCKVEKDPFTNEQVVSFNFDTNSVSFELKNGEILFEIIFNYWGERDYVFKKNTEVLFKLDNGNKIGLKTVRNSQPKLEKVSTSSGSLYPGFGSGMIISRSENFTAYSFIFKLTQTEINKLSTSRIEIIRIPDTDEGKHVDLEANGRTKKKIKAIKKGATCIIEHL